MSTTAHWRDPEWRYRNAEETRAPGYLQKRFDEIRRQQRQQEKQKAPVTSIKAKRRA